MQQASSLFQTVRPSSRPYAPSWVDALQGFVQRLPWPMWLTYAVAWLLLAAVETLLKWWDGTYPVGSFFALHLVAAGTGVYGLALMHYLDGAANKALDAFRPALRLNAEEVEAVRYRLTTTPRDGALLALAIGISLALLQHLTFAAPNPAGIKFSASGPAFVFEIVVLLCVVWGVGAVVVYHTVRQLRLIDRLYRQCANISLFNVGPLYAFSSFSARTGVAVLFIAYAWLATYPRSVNVALLSVFFSAMVLLALLAIATFVWPLWGAHQRLEAEKQRRKAEVNRRLEAVLNEQHQHMDAKDYTAIDGTNKAVAALNSELALIEKVSTWPWQMSTLRGFLTAVFLPLFLWTAQQFLSRLITP